VRGEFAAKQKPSECLPIQRAGCKFGCGHRADFKQNVIFAQISHSLRLRDLLFKNQAIHTYDNSYENRDFADVSDRFCRLSVGSAVARIWVSLTNQRPDLVVRV
jgi:hypothetical protein